MNFGNLNINLLIIYVILGILIISVITLFITFSKNKKSNSLNSSLTLDNLKVKNLEIDEQLISPKIKTKYIESTDNNNYKEIFINDKIRITKSYLYSPDLITDGLTSNIVASIKNMKVDNGYIKDFVNDNTITTEDFYNKTKIDKDNYRQSHNL